MDSSIRSYSLIEGVHLKTITNEPLESWTIVLNQSDKKKLATTGKSGNVNIWDTEEGIKVQTLETGIPTFTMSVDYVCLT